MSTDLDEQNSKEGKEPADKMPRVSEEVCNDNVSQVSHSRFVQVKNSVVQFSATIYIYFQRGKKLIDISFFFPKYSALPEDSSILQPRRKPAVLHPPAREKKKVFTILHTDPEHIFY